MKNQILLHHYQQPKIHETLVMSFSKLLNKAIWTRNKEHIRAIAIVSSIKRWDFKQYINKKKQCNQNPTENLTLKIPDTAIDLNHTLLLLLPPALLLELDHSHNR